MTHRKAFALGLILSTLCFGTSVSASASDEQVGTKTAKADRDWSIDFTPYLWVLNMNMTVEGGPIDNTFGYDTVQLLKSLSGYAMADLNVQYKRVGLMGDGMWARLNQSESRPALVGTRDLDLRVDMAWGTGAAFYEFRPTKQLSLSPYVGARWWRVNTQLEIVNTGGPLPTESGNVITKWADPVFGLMVDYAITDKWLAKTSGDVGGGVSKVSWQAIVGGEYKMTDWFALDVAYRIMGVNYQPSGGKINLKLNGILFGFKFHY